VDFKDIARWNNIQPPYAIYPGQRLQLAADGASGSFGHGDVVSDQPSAATQSDDDEADVEVTEVSAADEASPEVVETNRATTAVVKKGDTLFSIAQQNDLSHSQLARWNALHPPYALHKGQVLRLTPPSDRYTKAKPPVTPKLVIAAGKSPAKAVSKAAPPQTVASGAKPSVKKDTDALPAISAWHWPVKGRVTKTYKANDLARKGINISGKSGQAVTAAAGGKVVYSGNGLISYGNLIIIKHDDDFLSAYAHNQELLVAEGDDVKVDQLIARMGENNGRAQLHFEIRKSGKPVNPLQYLPKL
jgi:lipoprotein NlpD